MVAEFAKRRECVCKLIEETPGLSCIKPMGAFYVMMNVSSLFGKGIDGRVIDGSTAFTELLLEHAKVAVVPGIGFGADAFVRLSYAVSMETLQEGFRRIRSSWTACLTPPRFSPQKIDGSTALAAKTAFIER